MPANVIRLSASGPAATHAEPGRAGPTQTEAGLGEALMKADEDQAEALDKAHAEMANRALEVDEVIAAGAS
jgi:hypothetical protein